MKRAPKAPARHFGFPFALPAHVSIKAVTPLATPPSRGKLAMEPLPLALPLALLGASPVVVVGPAQSGRSALLFRAALAGAISSPAAGVIVLTPRRLQRIPGGAASAKAAGTGVMEVGEA